MQWRTFSETNTHKHPIEASPKSCLKGTKVMIPPDFDVQSLKDLYVCHVPMAEFDRICLSAADRHNSTRPNWSLRLIRLHPVLPKARRPKSPHKKIPHDTKSTKSSLIVPPRAPGAPDPRPQCTHCSRCPRRAAAAPRRDRRAAHGAHASGRGSRLR